MPRKSNTAPQMCIRDSYWFKLRKPKPDTKGSADLDDYDFGEEDDEPEETVDEDESV